MILLVTGDRHWTNRKKIAEQIYKRRKKIQLLIHGGAAGADLIADEYARVLGIQTAEFDANWTFYKRAAGPIRNRNMVKFIKPDLVLAFHKNLKKSKGTADMVSVARKMKIKVKVIK